MQRTHHINFEVLEFYTTQEIIISNSLINNKVKIRVLFTPKKLLGVDFYSRIISYM